MEYTIETEKEVDETERGTGCFSIKEPAPLYSYRNTR